MSVRNTILVRSRDRNDGGTSSNFEMKLQYCLNGAYRVKNVQMSNSVYSVRSGINDKIYFYENSTSKSATIVAGQYTSSTITTAIKTVMDTASGGHNTYTVSFDSATQKITFSASNAFYFEFATNTSASARRILGFNAEDTASGTSITSTNAIDLSGTHGVYIAIRQADHNLRTTSEKLKSSIYVPFGVSSNSFQNQWMGDINQIVEFDSVSDLSVKLHDDNGEDLSLHGIEWTLMLQKI